MNPRRHPESHYRLVAEVYLEAVEAGSKSPSRDVERTFGVPRSTANMWVKKARQRGLITGSWSELNKRSAAARPDYACRCCGLHCPPAVLPRRPGRSSGRSAKEQPDERRGEALLEPGG